MLKVNGIIINISKYKNNDCIFSILTKDRLFSVLGRGSLKLNNKTSCLNKYFIYGEFDLYQGPTSGLKLRDCNVFEYFSEYFRSYEDLMIFDFLVEITNKMILNSFSTDEYFDLLLNLLKSLPKKINIYSLTIKYFVDLLKINGLALNFDKCSLFDKTNENDFFGVDLVNGCVVYNKYNNYENLLVLKKDEILFLKDCFCSNNIEYPSLNKDSFLDLMKVLVIFLSQSLDIKLNSYELLKTI